MSEVALPKNANELAAALRDRAAELLGGDRKELVRTLAQLACSDLYKNLGFKNWRAFIEGEEPGLGYKAADLDRLLREFDSVEEIFRAIRPVEDGPFVLLTTQRGNSAWYLAYRIANAAPLVYRRGLAGEFATMKEAAIAAGLRRAPEKFETAPEDPGPTLERKTMDEIPDPWLAWSPEDWIARMESSLPRAQRSDVLRLLACEFQMNLVSKDVPRRPWTTWAGGFWFKEAIDALDKRDIKTLFEKLGNHLGVQMVKLRDGVSRLELAEGSLKALTNDELTEFSDKLMDYLTERLDGEIA